MRRWRKKTHIENSETGWLGEDTSRKHWAESSFVGWNPLSNTEFHTAGDSSQLCVSRVLWKSQTLQIPHNSKHHMQPELSGHHSQMHLGIIVGHLNTQNWMAAHLLPKSMLCNNAQQCCATLLTEILTVCWGMLSKFLQ